MLQHQTVFRADNGCSQFQYPGCLRRVKCKLQSWNWEVQCIMGETTSATILRNWHKFFTAARIKNLMKKQHLERLLFHTITFLTFLILYWHTFKTDSASLSLIFYVILSCNRSHSHRVWQNKATTHIIANINNMSGRGRGKEKLIQRTGQQVGSPRQKKYILNMKKAI